MKYFHTITVSVFIKPEENPGPIKEAFEKLFPFNMQRKITQTEAKGFNDRDIIILEATLKKEKRTNAFVKNLLENLNDEQKEMIKKSLDSEMRLYIRLDKQKLCKKQCQLTKGGDCFHIKLCLAAYPKKREVAEALLKEIFK